LDRVDLAMLRLPVLGWAAGRGVGGDLGISADGYS